MINLRLLDEARQLYNTIDCIRGTLNRAISLIDRVQHDVSEAAERAERLIKKLEPIHEQETSPSKEERKEP